MRSPTLCFCKDFSIKKGHYAHKDTVRMEEGLHIRAHTTAQARFVENFQTAAPDMRRPVPAECEKAHNHLQDGKDHGSIQGLAVAPSSEGP